MEVEMFKSDENQGQRSRQSRKKFNKVGGSHELLFHGLIFVSISLYYTVLFA